LETERLFVLFTAYFDESDTHGPAPTVILSAHVGHGYQWRQFERKLRRLQAEHGFSIFHAKDFKARRGEFEQWPDDKCESLISGLVQIIRETLTGGLTTFLEHDRYINEYRAPPIPRKMNLDSQLGVCFRGCLSHLLDLLEKRNYRDRLNIVMESGHRNVRDCERIFKDLKGYFRLGGKPDLFGEFTIESKEACPPLMVADLLGATHSMMRAAAGKVSTSSFATDFAANSTRKGAKLSFLELKPDAFRDLKIGFEKMRQRTIELWREQRGAKNQRSSKIHHAASPLQALPIIREASTRMCRRSASMASACASARVSATPRATTSRSITTSQ
jgi:hypothetical protein